MAIVPITLRTHLIPFFFRESQGIEASYGKYRVKSVLFSPSVSSIGTTMRFLMEKSGFPLPIDKFNLYITISDNLNKKEYKAEFYKHIDGANSYLKLPEEINTNINNLFEDIFRMAFTQYVNGCVEHNGEHSVTGAIDRFIDKYDLLEVGFCNDTLRRQYYREVEKDTLVSRFQNKKNCNVLNS
jgi:hypothetical protein